ncbi:MAG: nuclear transport factor 2 family protein [Actinomycetota bacterium]|nr:nuclear transport factor 2 family protein [Actinomycetota bacterium]
MSRPPLPPFDHDSAVVKVRAAEDAWNSRDPERVSLAYTPDSRWRNRSTFLTGRAQIVAFLTEKWAREHDYHLIKELWAYTDNRLAVRFAYEWRSDTGQWYRAYGNENWRFDADGLMAERHASINDLAIDDAERKFFWDLGQPRPVDHPGLSDLGL